MKKLGTKAPKSAVKLARCVLWYRASRRHLWRVVGSDDYAPAAWALVDASGHRGGDWMVINDGRDPNDARAKR